MLLWLITIFFLIVYAALISFYSYHWRKLKPPASKSSLPSSFISVIIAARNEELTLPTLLLDLQNQDFPRDLFEIIVVDDFSTDKTAVAVHKFKNVSLIQPPGPSQLSSKKKAIAAGVENAKGELIVITDADCRVQLQWLSTIESFYQKQSTAFIAAPVKFSYQNNVVEIFQAIDFLVLQGITAASVSANFHSMCNGANLAYTKKAFNEVGGFEGIDSVASGDDMLLMYKIWKKHPQNVFYLKDENAIVCTAPMKSWKDFFMQRRRWASKTVYYNDYSITAVLAFILLFNAWFFVLLFASFFNSSIWNVVPIFLIAKIIIEFPFVYMVSKFYKEQRLLKYFPLFQPLHIFYTVFIGILSQFGKYEWKGRQTK
jgi:cellulose synthase/poly-beta-1,6-N-acetylglucosamine synthase-like glycosyltransferase